MKEIFFDGTSSRRGYRANTYGFIVFPKPSGYYHVEITSDYPLYQAAANGLSIPNNF